jgi:pimeloyl-ACP methyl ester carboxylesterase
MILGGVSLGGWVCLDYALACPLNVHSLVLIAPAGATMGVKEEELRRLKRVFDYRNAEEFRRLINDYVLLHPKKIPSWVCALAVWRSRWNGHKHLLNNLTLHDWVGSRIESITQPAALVWGREDKVFPLQVGEEMSRVMTRARLFPLEDTGHSYLFERAEATCKGFMEGLDFVMGGAESERPTSPAAR